MFRLAADGIVSFSRRPLQAAIYIGLLLATLGFAFGIFTVASYFASPDFPAGWATLSVLVTTFSGVQLIFLGVIGEYIGTIFDEVKRRPHYIVEDTINISSVSADALVDTATRAHS
jgi:dolichol-phosphate mannosyltransferase